MKNVACGDDAPYHSQTGSHDRAHGEDGDDDSDRYGDHAHTETLSTTTSLIWKPFHISCAHGFLSALRTFETGWTD